MNKRQVIGWLAACTLLLSGCGAKPAATSGTAATEGAAAGAQSQAAPSTQGTQDGQASQLQKPAKAQGQQQGQSGKRPAMNPQMMQMMGTFQSLLSMDKQDGLSITKDEAAKLLPVVQDIVSAGQMSDEQSSKLRDPLTDDQKKYMDSFADKMKQRMANRGGSGGKQANGNGAQKQSNSSADNSGNGTAGSGGTSTNSGGSGSNSAGGNGGTGANNGTGGAGGTNANNGAAGGSGSHGQSRAKNGSGGQGAGNRNIGQQLIDLLQSKTK